MKACRNMFAVFQQKLDRCMYRMQAFFLFFFGGGGVVVACTICWTESHFIKKRKKNCLIKRMQILPSAKCLYYF